MYKRQCIGSPSQRRSEFPSLDFALIIEKNGFTLCPYLIRELGVDFALMSQTGQLVPFDYQDIFDSFSYGLGDVSIRPIN